jgi:UDP-GlcNAc3NAcA epimerase
VIPRILFQTNGGTLKILSIIGARPQFIKAAAVTREIALRDGLREVIVHTGQHYDANMSDIFFAELGIPRPEYNLEAGSGSHGKQTALILERCEEVIETERPDWVLVYGDTNSTVAGALAATKLHVPVAHVEAGLRSFNRDMPEEINRIATDHISDLLLVPTRTGMDQLEKEGLADISLYTGDVMYDSILHYRQLLGDERLPGLPEHYFAATLHRPQNTDFPEALGGVFSAFARLPHPVALPLHPRTRKYIAEWKIEPHNVILLDPLGYTEMLRLMIHAEKVLTDSGGLQKEAYFLRKQCITMRTETEWVETVHDNWNIVTAADPERIVAAVNAPLLNLEQVDAFGDGHAAKIIVDALLERRGRK